MVVFFETKNCVLLHRVVSGAKDDAEKVFRPDFCALRGSGSGGGGGALVLLLPVNRVPWGQVYYDNRLSTP